MKPVRCNSPFNRLSPKPNKLNSVEINKSFDRSPSLNKNTSEIFSIKDLPSEIREKIGNLIRSFQEEKKKSILLNEKINEINNENNQKVLILQNENEILKRNYKILEREHKKSLSILKYQEEISEAKNKNYSDSIKEPAKVKDVDDEINKIIKELQNEKSQSRNYKLLVKNENNTFDLLNNNLNETKIEIDESIKFETEVFDKRDDKIRYMSPTVSSSFKIVQNKNKIIKNRNLEMQKFVSIKSKKQRSKSPLSNKKIKSPQKNLKNKN